MQVRGRDKVAGRVDQKGQTLSIPQSTGHLGFRARPPMEKGRVPMAERGVALARLHNVFETSPGMFFIHFSMKFVLACRCGSVRLTY